MLVGLVHHDRHATTRGEVGGQRHVAAEAHDDVGADPVEHLSRTAHGVRHLHRQLQQVQGGLARHGDRGDQLQGIAPRGHQLVLQPSFGTQRDHSRVRPQPHHRVGEGHRGLDVPRRATARHHDGRSGLGSLRRVAGLGTFHRVAHLRLCTRRVSVAGPCLGHVRPSPVFPTRRTARGALTPPP